MQQPRPSCGPTSVPREAAAGAEAKVQTSQQQRALRHSAYSSRVSSNNVSFKDDFYSASDVNSSARRQITVRSKAATVAILCFGRRSLEASPCWEDLKNLRLRIKFNFW